MPVLAAYTLLNEILDAYGFPKVWYLLAVTGTAGGGLVGLNNCPLLRRLVLPAQLKSGNGA